MRTNNLTWTQWLQLLVMSNRLGITVEHCYSSYFKRTKIPDCGELNNIIDNLIKKAGIGEIGI